MTTDERMRRGGTFGLTLGALGVVFGDIGTSPLYAVQEVFGGPHDLAPDRQSVFGVLSLIFWALVIIVTLKYVLLVMRADNHGEGGIMALVALAERLHPHRRGTPLLVLLGVFGAALFYGDGTITPAISVLSAVEGIHVAAPGIDHLVVPIALAIIVALFSVQHHGTARVGALFGPVMVVWFATIGLLGAVEIARDASILWALAPTHAVTFFIQRPGGAFLALGSVVLAVTGAEALYADMGHFGRTAITNAWLFAAFPGLLLNYMGQGALLLSRPAADANPFFLLAPGALQLPLVVLATIATVIASQAVISGAASMTRQAIQLGFLPRMTVRHTSSEEAGQVYVPAVNWTLMVAVIALVLGFRSSSHLASAYGIAVTTTFVITTLLAFQVFRQRWHLTLWIALPGVAFFMLVELAFFGANLTKFVHGGWFPVLAALVVFTMLATWRQGRALVVARLAEHELPLRGLVQLVRAQSARNVPGVPIQRVPGTAVYLTANDGGTPTALASNVAHNHVLHERVVLATSRVDAVPRIPDGRRLELTKLGQGVIQVLVHYGFQEQPDIPHALRLAQAQGADIDEAAAVYFVGHFTLNPVDGRGMALWRKQLFAAMSKNSLRASAYLGVPSARVVEIGTQVDI